MAIEKKKPKVEKPEPFNPVIRREETLCECGKPVIEGTPQCFECSHRR